MPKSVASLRSVRSGEYEEEREYQYTPTALTSPTASRAFGSTRTSDVDLRSRLPERFAVDETTGLLSAAAAADSYRGYDRRDGSSSVPHTPMPKSRMRFPRQKSMTGSLRPGHSRTNTSFGQKLTRAFSSREFYDSDDAASVMADSRAGKVKVDDRVWYDQFTSTDWVHDSIADAFRLKELYSKKGFRGRVLGMFDAAQGWILVAIIGCVTAGFAYVIDVTESAVYDLKTGYCTTAWYTSKRVCCDGASICDNWVRWSTLISSDSDRNHMLDFCFFVVWVVVLALASSFLTMRTKTTISGAVSLSTLDEDLGADHHQKDQEGRPSSSDPEQRFFEAARKPPVVYYPAAGSGVAEVKVILSGFVLHGYLGVKTLVFKSLALILSVGSGLSIGKEGPYVHIAACIGNIACRLFPKYNHNDGKRREILSAAAASGVAVAFGAPISGVLFSLEEVSYYFPPKTLFRTFFCCIAAALSLKFLDPYGTKKIVLFEVRYLTDWRFFEIVVFAILGVLGGALGALFIKTSRWWAKTFRRIPIVKKHPIFEVFLVALVTGLVSFWNRYSRLPVAELLYELASPCDAFSHDGKQLCPTKDRIPEVIWYLTWAFVVKALLTTVTFGIKVPAGIYVPSMVVGGLLGRIVGHSVQLLVLTFPDAAIWGGFPEGGNPESIVVPGVYALAAAGATMCGVTRLSVTLSVILFELTGDLEHVLPFSLAVLVSKWTADALEPLSIYDLLTDMNAYPYLDAKARPIFTNDIGDLITPLNQSRIIDVTNSPLISATSLREKLDYMHMAGELDGGLPILHYGILVGLIPGPDLEFALDNLGNESCTMCLMDPRRRWQAPPRRSEDDGYDSSSSSPAELRIESQHVRLVPTADDDPEPALPERLVPTQTPQRFQPQTDPSDFTPYIDPAPVALDILSPMDLVFECFVKLGLRYICVLKEGHFTGLVHKKAFVRYVKTLEQEQRHGVP